MAPEPIHEETKEEETKSIDELVDSYSGTDFEEFCLYVKEGVEKLLPLENATRLEWKIIAAGMVTSACFERGIKIPEGVSIGKIMGR